MCLLVKNPQSKQKQKLILSKRCLHGATLDVSGGGRKVCLCSLAVNKRNIVAILTRLVLHVGVVMIGHHTLVIKAVCLSSSYVLEMFAQCVLACKGNPKATNLVALKWCWKIKWVLQD